MKIHFPSELPIANHADEIKNLIRDHDTVIIVGETGSGKSTQIPKMIVQALALLNAGKVKVRASGDPQYFFKIACTQPRRLAATSISHRIAEECEVELGKEIGYKIRFDDNTTKGSVITICTDGILLQEMKSDQLLSEYDAVLVDEAHERNLNIDFLLGLLKDIQRKRFEAGLGKLKIVITSATFDTEKFANFFREGIDEHGLPAQIVVPIVNVSGRMFPVSIHFESLKSGEYLYRKIAHLIQQIHKDSKDGDVLIFMPGEREIFSTIEAIEFMRLRGLRCLPLYSRLSMEDQELIFSSHLGIRHVIISTNIAETSLTVPGVRYVIDSGLARITDFDFRTGIGSLEVRDVSQASCIQRAGRAGRLEAGVCYRLFDEDNFENRERYTKPEIQRSDLASVVLHMISIGITDVYNFEFIDPPDPQAFTNAYKTLHELGALNKHNELTDLGKKMAHLPIEPRIATMLLAAQRYGCVQEIAIISSFLSAKDPFLRPKDEEDLADKEKRYFQKMANRSGVQRKTIKIRKGKRLFLKQIELRGGLGNSDVDESLVSDLVTFLFVWKRIFSITDLAERETFCKSHYINYKTMQEVEQIYEQLIDTLIQFGHEEFGKFLKNSVLEKDIDKESILKAISSGLIQNLCESMGGRMYRSGRTDNIMVHPGSALFTLNPRWFVAAEIIETTKFYARNNTVILPEWFEEIAPQLCTYKYGKIFMNEKTGEMMREEDVFFKGHKIVSKRIAPIGERDKHEAFEGFIQQAFIRKSFGYALPFIQHNEKVRETMLKYAAKARDDKYIITEQKLADWYVAQCRKLKVMPTSLAGVKKIMKLNGDDVFRVQVKDFLAPKEQERLDVMFPHEVYLNGRVVEVTYFSHHRQYPEGPALKLTVQDLLSVQPYELENVVPQNPRFKPLLMVLSGGETENILAYGYKLEEVQKDVDDWYLRKEWKRIRKKVEKHGLKRLDEVFQVLPEVLQKIEVGKSLFFDLGSGGFVYGYSALRHEGRKFNLILLETWAMACKNTLQALKVLFAYYAFAEMNFDEEELTRLEQRYEKRFFGIDVVSRLEEVLWTQLEWEKAFADFEKIPSLAFVKKTFEQKKSTLPALKKKVLRRFDELLRDVELEDDARKIGVLKKIIETGDWF